MLDDTPAMRAYAARWFIDGERLAAAAGCDAAELQDLIDAGAAPGPVYVRQAAGWWSALGRHGPHDPDGERWYAADGAWWLRRAGLARRSGLATDAAAATNLAAFTAQFQRALAGEALAARAYPQVFELAVVDPAAAAAQARLEWDDWRGGAYGVCLRAFTGWTCAAKEILAFVLREHLEAPPGDARRLTDDVALDLAHRLSSLILPFSPQERPTGTPGLVIDRLLRENRLGVDT